MPSSSSSQEYATYEATKAQEWNSSQADQIHWERDAAYRSQAYRQLHHQNGSIGTFQIRLLEAADLKRSYWSPLAVGPVKLLGLSKAHGPVSSFVSFSLNNPRRMLKTSHDESDRKPAANLPPPPPCFISPIIPHDDSPVWSNCHFDLPLRKGATKDGQALRLQIRVDEAATTVENLMPGIPSGGDSRMLGIGNVDLTSLCLGQIVATGQPQVGVLDTWIPIYLNGRAQEDEDEGEASIPTSPDPSKKPSSKDSSSDNENSMGRVRVLVSYQPNGMEPQQHDIVALEAFARQDALRATCRPILPSLLPLHVLKASGPWLLVEYHLGNHPQSKDQKACLKVHRNAVFVVERKNLIDGTLNLALLPADLFLSTSLGRSAQELVGPLVVAGKQLVMPALLSTKLIWMAIRTTGLATFTGVHAASSAMWSEGSSSLTQEDDRDRQKSDGNYKFVTL